MHAQTLETRVPLNFLHFLLTLVRSDIQQTAV